MRWLAESTKNKIGARSFDLTISITRLARMIASSTPSACPWVMPRTWIAPPSGRIACPVIIASVTSILPPFGNRPARMSSSVIGIFPVVGRTKERLGRKSGDLGRLVDAERLPDLDGVPGRAKALQSPLEARLLVLKNRCVASSGDLERIDRRVAKRQRGVVDERIGAADEVAVLAAHRAPDQRAVARVEFLDTL